MQIKVVLIINRCPPAHAWGGRGKMSVVEDFLLATAQPRLCGLKERSC